VRRVVACLPLERAVHAPSTPHQTRVSCGDTIGPVEDPEAPRLPGHRAEGWYADPSGRHSQRWYSGGWPTELVRDGGQDGRDPLTADDVDALLASPTEIVEDGPANRC
jgi:hypothetical protein